VIVAWLAIVALLIDALIPTAWAATTTGMPPVPVAAMCGGHADGAPAGKTSPLPPLRHCPCCCAATIFVAPGGATPLIVPRRVTPVSFVAPGNGVATPRPPRQSAQPRAPPALG
jgi:hypothetical protein